MTEKRTTRTVATAIGVAALAGVCFFAPTARSADHRDGDVTTKDPTADINDVYTFMDGNNAVFVMTIFPFATANVTDGGGPDGGTGVPGFNPAVQYVFHTTSGKTYPIASKGEDIICTFKSQTNVSCWVGAAPDDYVTGDPSQVATPLASADGKLQVFAGLRGDPFHFNLCGFKDAIVCIEENLGSLTFNSAGCPTNVATAGFTPILVGDLGETTPAGTCPSSANEVCPGKTVADDFAGADTLALVVSVDKSLVTKGGPLVSVWGATYAAP
jgi:hypothetical protein